MKTGFTWSKVRCAGVVFSSLLAVGSLVAAPTQPSKVELSTGWQLQAASKVTRNGKKVSAAKFDTKGWLAATVPGTILTSLVKDGVYPEPLYGENNRPDKIPETLARTPFWYRTVFTVPAEYAGKSTFLNFEGINYSADVWINGKQVGSMRGAFKRGIFDITSLVKPGEQAVLAVLVTPQPHPGNPIEHTVKNGVGTNGGITAIDGPTFLSTIGWDWIPGIRDRDSGIWEKVFLSATGPVLVKDPLVTTDLPLPKLDSTDIGVQARIENITDHSQKGVLKGSFGEVTFEKAVEIAPHSSTPVVLNAQNTPVLHVLNPKLWWPNGYGEQNLYDLHLSFEMNGEVSDSQQISFGVRKITYQVPDSENLTISVNGVRIFIRGGDWGLDEAMKRVPRERLEAQIRMHKNANMNMIRNWVGQSTNEDFYEMADKYGMLLWDEFFQPNPSDGPNPTDLPTYLANVRDKILRYRNHPSIAVWCARNEGYPPKEIDDPLRLLMAELEPTRLYQPSSTAGHGVNSGGPYYWREPREFYVFGEAFKTETGSVSVPTIQSIHGMMPEKDWETINDDWAEHDLARGASHGNLYRDIIEARYGKLANLADFVRKAQLANYEAFRAMYEGRNAKLFNPSTGVITWMSNPAQPSFVWQLYHHDLEANSSLFAVEKAAELTHIQMNELSGDLEAINNLPTALTGATAHVAVYNLDGSTVYKRDIAVTAPADATTSLGAINWPAGLSAVHFIKLDLRNASGTLLSTNFYWRGQPGKKDDLTALNELKPINLEMTAERHDVEGKVMIAVTIHNPGTQVALMTHLQLRRQASGERVLPVYYTDNYLSLVPNETRAVTIEASAADLKGETPLVVVDGWNVGVTASATGPVAMMTNAAAQVDHWPVTGIPMYVPPVQ